MLFLITGGSGSGKSEYAEELVCRLAKQSAAEGKRYVATMENRGSEAQERIMRHRAMRAGKGFMTIEAPCGFLTGEPDSQCRMEAACSGAVVLLECVSNLLANLMFLAQMSESEAADEIIRQISNMRRHCRHLVVVTNEVFSDGASYTGEMLQYMRALGNVNRALAACSDSCCEIVYSIPVFLKGEALCPC